MNDANAGNDFGAALPPLVVPARASTPLDSSRTILEQARAIVADNETHKEFAALSVLFGKFLDTGPMGRQALGQHWSSFASEEQEGLSCPLPRASRANSRGEVAALRKPAFRLCSQQLTGSRAIVDTRIVTPPDQFGVRYANRPSGDDWRPTENAVADVSLTAYLGRQFNDLLNRMSTDDLLALLRRKYGNPFGEARS